MESTGLKHSFRSISIMSDLEMTSLTTKVTCTPCLIEIKFTLTLYHECIASCELLANAKAKWTRRGNDFDVYFLEILWRLYRAGRCRWVENHPDTSFGAECGELISVIIIIHKRKVSSVVPTTLQYSWWISIQSNILFRGVWEIFCLLSSVLTLPSR